LSKKKRTRVELSLDEDSGSDKEDELPSSPLLAAISATNTIENAATPPTNSSDSSTAPPRAQKRKKRSPKKSHLRYEIMQPFFEVISSGIERIG
jgi:hypothetical protein